MMQIAVEVLSNNIITTNNEDDHFGNYYEADTQTILIVSHTFLSLCVFAIVKQTGSPGRPLRDRALVFARNRAVLNSQGRLFTHT